MNFIPDEIKKTGNYFCTWDSQCDEVYFRDTSSCDFSGRDAMCEEFLFGKSGLLNSFDGIRGDVIAVLDDGWDVPFGAKDSRLFGLLIPDDERFPSLKGLSPAKKLRALSDKVRAMGYRGLGLWIPSQVPTIVNGKEVSYTPEEERNYWEERAQWCGEAGVMYLKTDWGKHSNDPEYRAMMTDCMRRYAPDLLIEHAFFGHPLFESEKDGHEMPEHVKDFLRKVIPVSDFLRTNDVCHEVKYASTVDRAAICLEEAQNIEGKCAVLNGEDTALISAALGCAIGIMRHEFENKRKYVPLPPRSIAETECAVRWQRIAPPVPANIGKVHISSERLKDIWHCPDRARNLWPSLAEGDYYVTAPAAVSRNMPLPQVKAEGEKPYVLCSVHPDSGALCVSVTPRTFFDRIDVTPLASICVKGGSVSAPVGIFGRFESLSVVFDGKTEGMDVYAQNMLSSDAHKITDRVSLCGNRLTVSGELMEEIGKIDGGNAIPAVVIRLIGKNS